MQTEITQSLDAFAGLFNPSKLLWLILGVIALVWLHKGLHRAGQTLMQVFPARRFMLLQIFTLAGFAVYIGGTWLLIALVIEPPRELLLAAAGSLAVAVGIALKDIVASVIAGIVLLFDRPFQVGDRVSFGDIYGEIVSIGLRSVRLNTLDDNLVTIPNARFITETVASGNTGRPEMMVVTDFHLGLQADLESARSIVYEVIVTSRFAFLPRPVHFSIEEVALADRLCIRLRAKAYVLDVRYEKAFQSDIVLRASALLSQAGISRPGRDSSPAASPAPAQSLS